MVGMLNYFILTHVLECQFLSRLHVLNEFGFHMHDIHLQEVFFSAYLN